MNITEEQLKQSLLYINVLIKDCLSEQACEEYIILAKSIENEENQIDRTLKAEFYASFAYFLFTASLYEESLNMFSKAQYYGYSKEEIKKIVFEAFIEPNLNEFKAIYEQNIEFLISNGYISKAVEFDSLPFWLIPTMAENQYYIYDKIDEVIKEKVSINGNCNSSSVLSSSDELGDFLILEEWNWSNIHPYVNAVKKNNKKAYVVVNDIAKFLSCFQGEIVNEKNMLDILVFDGFSSMKEYFKGCSAYLPRNIINLMNTSDRAKKTIDEIHKYRISKEGRRGDNILLSICIPSYNRGNRAYNNIMHNLQCCYDEEIEIVLSNNGTQNDTKKYYERIPEINDSRVSYFAFEENQGVAINICKVCEIAQGRFILLLSDEDLVNLKNLHRILNMLNNMKETLSIMKTRGDVQAIPQSTQLAKLGREAMLTYMLTSNYMSGIIFNNRLLRQHNAIQCIKDNLDNPTYFYYPHMFLELLLCQYGDVMGTNIILINEGKAEITEVVKKEIGVNNKVVLPYYASIEGRLEQHEGFFNIFKELEICKKDIVVFREMYIKLCCKTIFLISFGINFFYKGADDNLDDNLIKMLDKAYRFCIKYLNEIYSSKKVIDRKYYDDDLEKIKYNYEYYKKQI